MSKSLRHLGLTDVDKVRQQIEEAANPLRAALGREAYSTIRFAEQLREMSSGLGIAGRAMESLHDAQSLAALSRDTSRVDWSSQLEELGRSSSLSTSNEVLNQITDQARRLTVGHGDLAQLASSQTAFEQILDQTCALVSGSSLQRMLEEEATRLQRAMAPAPDFWALESVVPQLQERLNRERRQWESLISQVAGPTGLSFESEATRLHEEIAQRASELSQFEPFIQEAIRVTERFQVDSWSPATVRSVLNAVRWDDLISAAQTHIEPTRAKQSTRKDRQGKSGRRRLTRADLAIIIAALSLIIGIIEALFESGLIQRFDAREPPATPVPTTQTRVEGWAIATLPTTLFADPSAQGARLFRVPAGAWLRVLEHRPQWLLVEVETGEHSRLQGWMRTLATRDLQDDVWQHGLEALASSTGTDASNATYALSNAPEVVRNAGEDARTAYAVTLASLRSRNTRAAYERAFARFFEFCSSAGIALPELTAIDVIAYVTGVAQQDSAATAKQHLIALRKLFDHLQVADVVAFNPTAGLKSPKPAPRPAVSVEGKEVERLLHSLAGTKEAEVRDRAIVTLIAGLGLKVSQLTALTLGAVEETSDGQLQLSLGPRRERVYVPAVANKALEAYVSLRRVASPPEAPLFVSTRTDNKEGNDARALARGEIYAMLKRRAQACGVPELSCEGLRHAMR